jgi:hypothetical protein
VDVKRTALTTRELEQRRLAPVKSGLWVRSSNGIKLRSRKVRGLVARMHAAMPWLMPSDEPTCRHWAELEILGSNLFADLVQRGELNDDGDPRRVLTEYRQLRQAQLKLEDALGMTPSSRSALGVAATSAADRVQDAQARLRKSLEEGAA